MSEFVGRCKCQEIHFSQPVALPGVPKCARASEKPCLESPTPASTVQGVWYPVIRPVGPPEAPGGRLAHHA